MKSEDDLVQSLLAHDTDVDVPAEHEQRIRAGLGVLLGAAPVAPAESPSPRSPPSPPSPPAAGVGSVAGAASGKLVGLALALAIGAGAGFAVGRATAPAPALPVAVSTTTAVPTTPTTPATPAPAVSSAATTEPTAAASVTAPSTPSASSAAPTTTAPALAPTSTDAFDREQSLLERARSALVRHDGSAAEKALDEHDRQFPRSRLAEERDYLRIQVLRERGDDARVRERAKAFLAKYPGSLLRARVEPLAN